VKIRTSGGGGSHLQPFDSPPTGVNWDCVPAYVSPAWNATFDTTTPEFQTSYDGLDASWSSVDIEVTDSPTSPTWGYEEAGPTITMPAGVLQDGGTYYWAVYYTGATGDNPGCPPYGWGPFWEFHVNLHVQDTNDPTDSLASATVDLASGGLSYTEQAPSFTTPGGPVGFSFTYNSRAETNFGLTTAVYQNPEDLAPYPNNWPQEVTQAPEELWSGTEPGVVYPEFLAAANSDVTGWYVVSYTGLLALPAGNWTLQLSANPGDVQYYNNSDVYTTTYPETTLWLGTPTSSSPTAQVLGNGTSVNTTNYSYTSNGKPVTFALQAVAGTSAPMLEAEPSGGSFAPLSSSWFSSASAVLPDGWSESSDGLIDTDYNYLSPGANTVEIYDSSGQAHIWNWTGSGYSAPDGDQGSLTHNSDGSWTLVADDGYTYQFNPTGQLTYTTQPTDDQHQGSPTFTYSTPVSGLPQRLTSVVDAAGRGLSLIYGGNDQCPTASGFDADAPADMLCEINYDPSSLPSGATSGFEAGTTDIYYSSGHIAAITEPGQAGVNSVGTPTTTFSCTNYTLDSATYCLVSEIGSQLYNDVYEAYENGTVPSPNGYSGEPANANYTVISYETPADGSYAVGQVSSVTAPTAAYTSAAWGNRAEHSYTYAPAGPDPSTTDVTVAGETTVNTDNYAQMLSFDSGGFVTQEVGADGVAVDDTWDDATQQVLTETDHHIAATAGLETTYAYDPEGRQTDQWGPAPPSCFSGVAGNNNDTYYEPNGTCTPVPPHTNTAYDGGLDGLAAVWYNNNTTAEGQGALHTFVPDGSFSFSSYTPGTGIVASDPYSGTLTGWITVPSTAEGVLVQTNGSLTNLSIDGLAPTGIATGPSGDGCPTDQNGEVFGVGGEPTAPGVYQIQMTWSWAGDSGPTPYLNLDWYTGNTPQEGSNCWLLGTSPVTSLDPGYNYVTSTQTDNAGTGTSNSLTDYVYGDPAHGLETQKIVDPNGQDLVTNYSYEGSSGFYDLSATTLPAGNATTDTYYNGTDAATTASDPCVTGSGAVNQGDNLYQQVTPARTETFVYNTAGQVLASRLAASDGWTCTSYDARGRVTSVQYPAFDGTPAYTDTYNYIVGGNPQVTSVTKSVSGGPTTTITTTVDLLGRVVSYTDANGNATTTSYDQVGRVTSTCFTPSGGSSCASTVGTTYDSHGRVANDSYNASVVDTPAYDSDSDLTGDSYGNGTSLGYTYDTEGRTTAESFLQSGGSQLLSDTEVLSQAGDVQTDTEDGPSGQVGAETYAYDSAGRLITANGDGKDISYGYSSTGGCGALVGAGANSDRTQMTETNTSTSQTTASTYCYGDDDQLTSYQSEVEVGTYPVTVTTPGYDNDGNTSGTEAGTANTSSSYSLSGSYSFPGGENSNWTVPSIAGSTVGVSVSGAGGGTSGPTPAAGSGSGAVAQQAGNPGGPGGVAQASLPVTSGESLTGYVAGQGGSTSTSTGGSGGWGYADGGNGGSNYLSDQGGGGGGGASALLASGSLALEAGGAGGGVADTQYAQDGDFWDGQAFAAGNGGDPDGGTAASPGTADAPGATQSNDGYGDFLSTGYNGANDTTGNNDGYGATAEYGGGGGGGGGYYGGAGGYSLGILYPGGGAGEDVSYPAGGGGSSWVSSSTSDTRYSVAPSVTNGSVTVSWNNPVPSVPDTTNESFTYDAQDQVVSITTATQTITYVRDAQERVVQYEVTTSGTLSQDDLYGYAGPGSSPASITNVLTSGGGTTTTTAATTTTTAATTTTTSGTTTTTGCSSSSITAVGSLAQRFGSNTLSVSPVNTGDIEALAIQGQPESSPVVSSVSGGGVTTWSKAIAYPGSATSSDIEIWWGKITSTGSSTITVTWTGSNPSYRELDAHEFSGGSGATWSVDKTGDASSGSATSYNMASLTPSGTGELYFGLAVVGGDTATAGSTSGVTYNVDDNGNLLAYDTNVSAALAPAGSQTGGTGVDSAAALLTASSGSCGGTTTTTAATTTTTHPTTTTTAGTTTTTSGSGPSGSITYMVNLTGGVLLEVTGSTETWYYPNLEGGTAAEASSTGTAVGGITLYDPFGNALTSLQADSPDGLAYGFEGKHGIGTDTDAGGVVLMGGRLYDPMIGRFLEVDPVFGGNCNAYDYVCQDPVDNIDLNGEFCVFGHNPNGSCRGSDVYHWLTTPENAEGVAANIRGLQRQLQLHEEKLSAYVDDPLAYDNDGRLRAAVEDGNWERAADIINGRVNNLLHQIDNFQQQIQQQQAKLDQIETEDAVDDAADDF
jgi:RHS repeat-associated protein